MSDASAVHDAGAPRDRAAIGWVLLAFRAELANDVTPVTVAGRPLMVVRDGDAVRVTDATCPHRGAHLGYGGELTPGGIRCPFHGRLVRLGEGSGGGYFVREHPTVSIGEAIFVLVDGLSDNGFRAMATSLARSHALTPGFRMSVAVESPYVVENVFDAEHFESVHKVSSAPVLTVRQSEHGGLVVDGALESPAPNLWQDVGGAHQGPLSTRLCAHVFSPNLVVTELGSPEAPSIVITGATPTAAGTVIRVAALLPRGGNGAGPRPDVVAGLIADSRTAFEQDSLIWEHLVPGAPQNFDERDDTVAAFRRFCDRFGSDLVLR
jgi:3-ketosteroid 9alpha-monooxygenase subunit A